MFWTFELSIFHFFAIWVTKLKPSSGKLRQSNENYLNPKLVIGGILENGFEATLRSKMNVLNIWKWHFSVFWKILSDEVKTVFWKSEAKYLKLQKSKFIHRKHFRKWFWSYLELEKEYSKPLKLTFSSLLQIFEWQSWNCFLGKQDKASKTFCI